MPVTTMRAENKESKTSTSTHSRMKRATEGAMKRNGMEWNGRESRRRKCGSNPNAMETHAETAVHRCRS